ncbi:MAG: YqjF family protein [Chloroflexota bacterium]
MRIDDADDRAPSVDSHRVWPVRMRWEHLLFAHWPVDAEELSRRLPPDLLLDTWEGEAWIGVVPFLMTASGPNPIALPGPLGTFGELNVRTYVRPRDPGDGPPGILFLSLDCANPLAVEGARLVYRLPYFHCRIGISVAGPTVTYRASRRDRRAARSRFEGTYWASGEATAAADGSLADWLTARFALYSSDRQGRVYRGDIRHRRWQLAPATLTMRAETLLAGHGVTQPAVEPLLHLTEPVDVVAALPVRIR